MEKTLLEKRLEQISVETLKDYERRYATPFPDLLIRPSEMDVGYAATFSNGDRTGENQTLMQGHVSLVPFFVPAPCRVTGINVMNALDAVSAVDLELAVYGHDEISPLPYTKLTSSYFVGGLEAAPVVLVANQRLSFVDEGRTEQVWVNNALTFTPFALDRGVFWAAVLNRGALDWVGRGASNTHGVTIFNMFLHSSAWTSAARGLHTSVPASHALPTNMKEGRLLRPTFTGVSSNLLRLRSSVLSVEFAYELP